MRIIYTPTLTLPPQGGGKIQRGRENLELSPSPDKRPVKKLETPGEGKFRAITLTPPSPLSRRKKIHFPYSLKDSLPSPLRGEG